MVSRAESGEGRKRPGGAGLGGSAVVAARRPPLGSGGVAPPGPSPTSTRAACRWEDLLRWNSVDDAEARSRGHPAFPPFPAGLASAILGTVARPPRLPALPRSFYFLSPSFRKLIQKARGGGGQSSLEGMRVGSEASRERPGSWVEGGSGLPGALPMEMAPDGPGLPPWPPFLRSLGRATWADGTASDF